MHVTGHCGQATSASADTDPPPVDGLRFRCLAQDIHALPGQERG